MSNKDVKLDMDPRNVQDVMTAVFTTVPKLRSRHWTSSNLKTLPLILTDQGFTSLYQPPAAKRTRSIITATLLAI